ncbi:solute carrier family 2, facilitated glucose transporter member 9-like [Narcine bancroftii]|uniref:solute carrier family 2, facilitated glucose transporter member 9-like n=1 Tax=Narcine bancroftii TaxID=1343680 RepID=UPI0038312439
MVEECYLSDSNGKIVGYIKDFYNHSMVERYNQSLTHRDLVLLYSVTISVFAVGGMVGALLVGLLVSRFGQKSTLVYSTLLVFLAGLLMGLSRMLHSPEMVILGRFAIGIHSGLSLSIVPMYLGEIAPFNLRGFLGLIPTIFICLGVFFAQVLGLHEVMGKEQEWPLLLSLVVLPALMELLLLPWFPESPRYLMIQKEDYTATVEALMCFRNKCNVSILAEIEEMQEEQRSLASLETATVWQLMTDPSMRWQLGQWMQYGSVACVLGIIAGFCIGPAGVPFLLTAELFTQSHRPAAYIIGGSLNWLSNFTVGFAFPFLQMSAGAYCYLVFCGVCCLICIYVHIVIPETKNKSFTEISQMFSHKRPMGLHLSPNEVPLTRFSIYGTLQSRSSLVESSTFFEEAVLTGRL